MDSTREKGDLMSNEENGTPTDTPVGSNWKDVIREAIRAVRDILNDWRGLLLVAIVVLIAGNWLTGSVLFDGLVRLVHAWRGTGAP